MVLAWKKFHASDALMLSEIPSVCALLPNISASARKSAITEINSAIFLFRLSPTAMPVLLMFDLVLDFMLDRVHAVTHVALRASSGGRCIELAGFRKGEQSWRLSRVGHARGWVLR